MTPPPSKMVKGDGTGDFEEARNSPIGIAEHASESKAVSPVAVSSVVYGISETVACMSASLTSHRGALGSDAIFAGLTVGSFRTEKCVAAAVALGLTLGLISRPELGVEEEHALDVMDVRVPTELGVEVVDADFEAPRTASAHIFALGADMMSCGHGESPNIVGKGKLGMPPGGHISVKGALDVSNGEKEGGTCGWETSCSPPFAT
eukprot:CAMPEP_0194551088 /NCGR_PEP_ID=MMETSP0253-20130528/96044_1 /TAXON_ID=2966 /ORGANISM="Noctiluca scintillans" /LENGTH=205 /DNA_ID=CAMNT_0039398541 /DNA_START=968 /DNA_END=1585 /DNA_ORIENTATION=+